jgi:CRP-like cAMP-binding protein
VSDVAARLAALPLCADFSPAACAALARLAVEETLADGAPLIRQGRPATSAYALLDGELAVERRLPGGGHLPLARLTGPALVGELGLLADVRRTADVRANGRTHVLRWERRLLDAACALGDASARTFIERVVAQVAALNARLLAQIAERSTPASPCATPADPAPAEPPFDHLRYAALLKPFEALDETTRAALLDATDAQGLAPGEVLYAGGSPVDGIAFVLRGALEVRPRDGTAITLQVLGPGALAGLPDVLLGKTHAVSCHAREHSMVRRLPQARFTEIYGAHDARGLALRAAVATAIADSALALSNRLAQRVGLERVQALLLRDA